MRSIPASALLFFSLCSCTASGSHRSEPEEPSADYAETGHDDGFYLGEAPAAAWAVPLVEATATAPAPAPTPVPDTTDERQMIYSAALRLVVPSAREAHASVLAIAREAGGHLQESDARSLTIRVPADTFERVVARISGLGEVVESNVRATDVTEEMFDLGIRLENARKARERLLEHLEKSDKIEDTLKIELELTRVTGEIEQLEGRLRLMQSRIAMSTIRVELNTNEPERSGTGLVLPFEWVGRLGDGLVAGTVKAMPRKPRFLARGPRFQPPAEFVRYFSSSDLVEAMNAAGVRLKLQEQDNYDEGALAFWYQLARRALVETRALAVTEERDLGQDRRLLAGTREVGSQSFGYLLVLARTDDEVYTFEAWGPKESFEPLVPALVESAKSLRR